MSIDFSQSSTVEIAISMAIGLLLLLAGYRIKKIAFFLIWFFIGFTLVQNIMPWLQSMVPAVAGSELWGNLLPLAGGLLLALMGLAIEKLCVGGIVFAGIMLAATKYFGGEVQTLLISGVIGTVAAGLAVMMMKTAVVIATSFMGAYMLTAGLLFFVPAIDAGVFYFPILIGITAVGTGIQLATSRGD